MSFPSGFTWGVATSAYQIEGGRTDGKGQSIWDTFSDQGRLRDRGDLACDHYHRWPEDVELMRQAGITSYRFSIAWTRVLPDGDGEVNRAGLGFYDRLVDGLLAAGIEPWLTLYHWDLPQALQDRGGWANRDSVGWFLRYTDVMAKALGDRVRHWITHNEPWVAVTLGHIDGSFAPGVRDWRRGLAAGHHILLSHGQAVPLIRASSPGARVGIALDCRPATPATLDPADMAACRYFDGFRNRWYFDPIFGRGYPADIAAIYRERGRWSDELANSGDLETIAAPVDFVGVNYYTSLEVAVGGEESESGPVPPGPKAPAGYTEMGWKITPGALTDFLIRITTEYRPARIVITENGASYSDSPGPDGRVHDQRRIDYLAAHIAAVEGALAAGAPVSGYFVWSLLDNLEWTSGFSQRFGLVHVDHESLVRTPKDSLHWYGKVATANALDAKSAMGTSEPRLDPGRNSAR
ncbi:MAG: GH1 family beta-glucosidase [Acidimicrobiia bacterium]